MPPRLNKLLLDYEGVQKTKKQSQKAQRIFTKSAKSRGDGILLTVDFNLRGRTDVSQL